MKSKGEKEKYTHLNAEFQRIARRNKKAFPSDQCKEIEENNRMGKTTDLLKKIRDTKGRFHAKMGTIKDRNVLNDPDNHDSVITHLDPDILECEVKWALGRITTNKASGSDGIPVELFQILKMMLLKCCTQYVSKFGKLSSGHRTGKGQFSFQSQRKEMPKNANYRTIALISPLVK